METVGEEMNGKPLIIDIQGKALETDKKRKQDELKCHNEIAAVLKKYNCKFDIGIMAIVENGK